MTAEHDEAEPIDAGTPHTIAALQQRIQAAYDAVQALTGEMSDEDLSRPGGVDGWSVKDHLAHIAAWERSLLALLEGRPRHEAVNLDRDAYQAMDTDSINAWIYAQNRERPSPEVLADLRATHARIAGLLGGMTDVDLTKPYSHYQPDEPPYNPRPVIGWIVGNTYEHMEEHLEWMRALRG